MAGWYALSATLALSDAVARHSHFTLIAVAVSRFELFLWSKQAADILRRAPAVSRRMLNQGRRFVPVDNKAPLFWKTWYTLSTLFVCLHVATDQEIQRCWSLATPMSGRDLLNSGLGC